MKHRYIEHRSKLDAHTSPQPTGSRGCRSQCTGLTLPRVTYEGSARIDVLQEGGRTDLSEVAKVVNGVGGEVLGVGDHRVPWEDKQAFNTRLRGLVLGCRCRRAFVGYTDVRLVQFYRRADSSQP